jgi:regulator of sigma E protease
VQTEVDLDKLLAQSQGPLQLQIERPEKLENKQEKLPTTQLSLSVPRQPGSGYAALGAEGSDAYIYQVVPGSPAATAGIQPGDRLVSLDGKPLPSFRILAIALGDLREKPFQLGWRHGLEERSAHLHQVKRDIKDEMGAVSEQLDLGVEPRMPRNGEVPEPEFVSVYHSPLEALKESVRIVPEIIGKTAMVIGMLFTGQVPFKTVGGPIMLYQLASKSAEAGIEQYLNLMAVISINLGMMNLLPIPVLDGFQLLASVWEGIRRRPIPMRAREIANAVGLAMLVILMILVFKNDLTR